MTNPFKNRESDPIKEAKIMRALERGYQTMDQCHAILGFSQRPNSAYFMLRLAQDGKAFSMRGSEHPGHHNTIFYFKTKEALEAFRVEYEVIRAQRRKESQQRRDATKLEKRRAARAPKPAPVKKKPAGRPERAADRGELVRREPSKTGPAYLMTTADESGAKITRCERVYERYSTKEAEKFFSDLHPGEYPFEPASGAARAFQC